MSEIKPFFSDYIGLYGSSLSFTYDFRNLLFIAGIHKTWRIN
jgi:hypothetical protein